MILIFANEQIVPLIQVTGCAEVIYVQNEVILSYNTV